MNHPVRILKANRSHFRGGIAKIIKKEKETPEMLYKSQYLLYNFRETKQKRIRCTGYARCM
jgi:hypothetical protein